MRAKFEQVRKLGGDVDAAMRNYLGDVAALDDCVGRLLTRLDDLGLSERTLVVFSSDHGPAPVEGGKDPDSAAGGGKTRRDFAVNMLGSPGPFQGGKHTQHEGGLRVPFILRWPGRVPADRVDEASVLSAADWLPTLCRLAGVAPPADLDGEDTLDAWLGQRPHVRTKPLLWKTNSTNSDVAIRLGPWKLHMPHRKRGELELFHVIDDPAELTNRAAERPEVVAELRARAEAWSATLPREYDKSGPRDD
jgi:N-acetylgalactosamine-6-sulfatase